MGCDYPFDMADYDPVGLVSDLEEMEQVGSKLVTQHCYPKAAAPWIDPAQNLVDCPNENSTFENYFERYAQSIRWMPSPDQDACNDYNP